MSDLPKVQRRPDRTWRMGFYVVRDLDLSKLLVYTGEQHDQEPMFEFADVPVLEAWRFDDETIGAAFAVAYAGRLLRVTVEAVEYEVSR